MNSNPNGASSFGLRNRIRPQENRSSREHEQMQCEIPNDNKNVLDQQDHRHETQKEHDASYVNTTDMDQTTHVAQQTSHVPDPSRQSKAKQTTHKDEDTATKLPYSSDTTAGRILNLLSITFNNSSTRSRSPATFAGFLSLLLLTMSNYMLGPMRDAAALKVGVSYIPILTLVSTILALASSVPVGWLFEAPNPMRSGRSWRGRIGLTRGETQGTSLALFLRCFAICLFGYAFSFKLMDLLGLAQGQGDEADLEGEKLVQDEIVGVLAWNEGQSCFGYVMRITSFVMGKFGKMFYVMFFLVVHLMKLHSISLMWGVTSEAMEYEEQAELRAKRRQTDGLHSDIADGTNNNDGQVGGKSRARLKRLAFVGFGGTLGGIMGSVFVSMTAQRLRLSGLLIVAATLLLLSAELSIELGQIMLRHWEEEQMDLWSQEDLTKPITHDSSSPADTGSDSNLSSPSNSTTWENLNNNDVDTSMKRIPSIGGGIKRIASGMSINSVHSSSGVDSSIKKVGSVGSMKRIASGNSINNIRRAINSGNNLNSLDTHSEVDSSMKKVISVGSMKRIASAGSMKRVASSNSFSKARNSGNNLSSLSAEPPKSIDTGGDNYESGIDQMTGQNIPLDNMNNLEAVDDNSFKQRLLRGVTTIIKSRLLMTIFTYNALYATTTVLLSFQRAELVANRTTSSSVDSDTAFLANINIASSVAVFALQASGLGAYIANTLGLRGTLSLMPLVRLFGVAALAFWHVQTAGQPPNLVMFLVLDEFTKVINFAVAKPVRENLWRGLSNEARYEAKPIVDTLANRWGGGSAAFLMSLLDRIMMYSGLGEELEDGTKSLFGFPPLLILCSISAVWWAIVSTDLGHIRHRIDLELKKQTF